MFFACSSKLWSRGTGLDSLCLVTTTYYYMLLHYLRIKRFKVVLMKPSVVVLWIKVFKTKCKIIVIILTAFKKVHHRWIDDISRNQWCHRCFLRRAASRHVIMYLPTLSYTSGKFKHVFSTINNHWDDEIILKRYWRCAKLSIDWGPIIITLL